MILRSEILIWEMGWRMGWVVFLGSGCCLVWFRFIGCGDCGVWLSVVNVKFLWLVGWSVRSVF